MPGLLDTDALHAALDALTARPGGSTVGSTSPAESDRAATTLAFRVLGAAEGQAMRAQAAGGPGAVDLASSVGVSTDEVLIAEAFGAAGCEGELDALALLRWRAGGLSQALDYVDLGGPYGVRDRMMGTIGVTAAALARMVAAAYVMRDPESKAVDQREAAETWWAATESLRQALGTEEVKPAPEQGHQHGPQGCPDCG